MSRYKSEARTSSIGCEVSSSSSSSKVSAGGDGDTTCPEVFSSLSVILMRFVGRLDSAAAICVVVSVGKGEDATVM